MIKFLNVYYPTRTVILPVCEAILVAACFLIATLAVLGFEDGMLSLNYQYGFAEIAAVTLLTLVLSYYFDLYEPQLVSSRFDVYFRVLLVLAFDCFIVSALMWWFPEIGIARNVPVVGFTLLTIALIAWRRSYDWIVWLKPFRERVFVLGAGEQARSLVHTLQTRPDVGMEVVDWVDVQLEHSQRKQYWIETLDPSRRHQALPPPHHRGHGRSTRRAPRPGAPQHALPRHHH